MAQYELITKKKLKTTSNTYRCSGFEQLVGIYRNNLSDLIGWPANTLREPANQNEYGRYRNNLSVLIGWPANILRESAN